MPIKIIETKLQTTAFTSYKAFQKSGNSLLASFSAIIFKGNYLTGYITHKLTKVKRLAAFTS